MIYHLQNRFIIRVQGPDAQEFLQNTLTNDIRKISAAAPLQYNLLLSPQGMILHEIFVLFQGEGDYLLDTFTPRREDLLRRLTLFKLRAKVELTPLPAAAVYAILPGETAPEGAVTDPRRPDLGHRFYSLDGKPPTGVIEDEPAYLDACIDMTVPAAEAMRFEKDFVHDLGLQNFNAIAWDKGCFIGQEVAARVEHRGLSKKSLFTISASQLDPAHPAITLDGGMDAGELRLVSRDGTRGLAVLRKLAVESAEKMTQAGRHIQLGG